jgi:hypothetical protein
MSGRHYFYDIEPARPQTHQILRIRPRSEIVYSI